MTYRAGHCDLPTTLNGSDGQSIHITKRDVVIPRGDRRKRQMVYRPREDTPPRKARRLDPMQQQLTSLSAGRSSLPSPSPFESKRRGMRARRPNAAARDHREKEERFFACKRVQWAERLVPDVDRRPASEIQARLLAKVRSTGAG